MRISEGVCYLTEPEREWLNLYFIALELKEVPLVLLPVPEYAPFTEQKWRIDFALPFLRLGAEIQGGVYTGGKYTRGPAIHKLAMRNNTLLAAKWFLFTFPAPVVPELVNLFAQQALRMRDEWALPWRSATDVLNALAYQQQLCAPWRFHWFFDESRRQVRLRVQAELKISYNAAFYKQTCDLPLFIFEEPNKQARGALLRRMEDLQHVFHL